MVKIFEIKDAPMTTSSDGKKTTVIITDVAGAKEIGVVMAALKPGAQAGPYHYHIKRESIFIVLSGKAKAMIEGKDYDVGPNTIVFIPPKEKHNPMLMKNIVGDEEYKVIEIFSHPEPDRVDVPEEK
jgi:uncharacterized cupin superfamily protein